MTTVQNYIRELLFEQDCVVIPDFGGFITNFDCAKVEKSQDFIRPARKWLAFNGLLKNDDGLLSNYIAKNEGISREEANQRIRFFVEETKKSIRLNDSFCISGVGTFTQNEEAKIQFLPFEQSNFLGESFGLEKIAIKKSTIVKPTIQIEPINRNVSQKTIQQVFATNDRDTSAEEIKMVSVSPRKRNHKNRKAESILKFLAGMVSASLFVSAIYLYDNEKNSLSSFNPFHFSQKTEQVIEQPLVNTTPKLPKQLNVVVDSTIKDSVSKIEPVIINDSLNRFFVITGSFGEKENAEKQLNILKRNGFMNASILKPTKRNRLIKVSAGGYKDEELANEEAIKVTKAINQSTWIFKK